MLQHGTPWQAALGAAFLYVICFSIAMLLSLLSGFFGWHSLLTVVFLGIGFVVIIALLPLMLNLSREFFRIVLGLLIVHIITTIVSFALHYQQTGLLGAEGEFLPSFYDSVYFSITTFTTLGYGDLQPLSSHRLTTSIEALTGMVSMAIGASLIWLWCQENMVPKEMAFFDGNRRHKNNLAITRIRIRTITGKERSLKDWKIPPKEGEAFYYDEERQEWLVVTDETKLPENALVMGLKPTDDDA